MLAAGEKPVALAHSMGAHILLRRLARRPGSFGPSVLSAPMIDISFRDQREFLVRAVTRYQMWRGKQANWVWGMEERDPHKVTFATQLVTSDPQRFERTQSLVREQPDLRLAGATWGWLAAALRSVDWLKPQAPACHHAPPDGRRRQRPDLHHPSDQGFRRARTPCRLCRNPRSRARDPDGALGHPRQILGGVRWLHGKIKPRQLASARIAREQVQWTCSRS